MNFDATVGCLFRVRDHKRWVQNDFTYKITECSSLHFIPGVRCSLNSVTCEINPQLIAFALLFQMCYM